MLQSHSPKASGLRRKAQACDALASCARSRDDREQLLRMRDTNLALAAREDRLDGLPPLPPAQTVALFA